MQSRTRSRKVSSVFMGAVSLAALALAGPALAEPPDGYRPPVPQRETPVAGVLAKPVKPDPVPPKPIAGKPPVWPAAAAAQVAAAPNRAATRAGSLPVLVQSASTVRVRTLDRAAARAAGVSGLALQVSTVDKAGPVRVTVDYSSFRWAYGGDWATRLRLAELPCGLARPGTAAGCRPRPLATDNNAAAGTASATVNAASGGTVVALDAAASGPAGDFSATSLTSSGTWSAGGNSGNFSWSYPMRMPPSLGGPAPSVGLSYSSSSVDGRMAASNNQPSLIGEGFDWSPGGIERTYVPCGADRGNGANNTDVTGDECWLADNATLAMSGHAGELIKDETNPNRWHLRQDDGTFVEHRTGAGNGALNGEWWVAITTDGTQYWFGGVPATNSTLTVPVYGNHPGEPCHAATFAASSCYQAYRWNLDRVVDPRGNTMTYVYGKETNKYARNMNPNDLANYDRSSYPVRIEYGTRVDRTESAPMQVLFTVADRCTADCGVHDGPHWPDTPWDQECAAAPCGVPSPTFWSTKRLAAVTTRVGGTDVERWTLNQSFPDPGDGTRAGLWLDRISHAGLVGGTTPLPDVTFTGVQMPNRVDAVDHSPAMNWWRIKTVNTETGGKIDITYSPQDCVAGSRMPDVNALQNNTLRCYPVRWTPPGAAGPVTDFFHKYVVTDVVEADLSGGAPRVRTHYDYLGTPAWHWTDDDGIVVNNNKTWSVWRGYSAVRAIKGDQGEQTATETRFFRGMSGDHLPTGTRAVQLPAISPGNVPAVNDEDVYAGMVRESITYAGPGGGEVSATAYEPWQSPPTTRRTSNGVTVYARHVQAAVAHTRTVLDGGRPARTTTVRTTFDDTYGMAVSVEDLGDDAVTGDEKCALTEYARNTAAWIVSAVSRARSFATDCTRAQGTGLRDDDVLGEDRSYYDNQALGVPPTKGEVTSTEVMKAYNNGSPAYLTTVTSEYDGYGRVTKGTDVRGKVTTSAYTPNAGGPVTQLAQTTNGTWTTTVTMAPAWGVALSTVDANGRRTELAYDPLGRLASVWKPGRDRAGGQSPNITYDYAIHSDSPSVVTTRTLTPAEGYVTSYALYDSLLRTRQTQRPDAQGGPDAVLTDTYYDTAGRASKTNGSYLSTLAPTGTLIMPTAVVPSQTETRYDGAGRTTASILKVGAPPGGSPGGTEKWRTTTAYGGDRTDVTPPAGGVVTSTVVDARGRTTQLRQYHAGVPAGAADPGGFDATGYTYNGKGQLVKVTDPAGEVWTYGFDFPGRQNSLTDPDKGGIRSVFNDAGDLVQSTDARNQTLAYTYDQMGRKTAEYSGSVAPANLLARWDYDMLSNGTTVVDQLVRTTRIVAGAAYVKEITAFTVDYQPNTVTYTVPANQTGLAGTYGYTYTYNADGSPRTVRMPAVGDVKAETLSYGYDPLGQASTMDSAYGATSTKTGLVSDTGYLSFGELGAYTLRTNGNMVGIGRSYDTDTRRLTQILTTRQTAPTNVADVRYTYDPAGNVTRIADQVSGDTQCFRTDHLARLTEGWTPSSGDCAADPTTAALGGPASYWQSYTYDVVGNRTRLVEHGTPGGDRTTTYTVPGGKHLMTTMSTVDSTGTSNVAYGYDQAGNLQTRGTGPAGAQTLTWDAEGRLGTVSDSSGKTAYLYDADGTRLIRSDPGRRTLYLHGQELRYTISTGAATGVRYYTHAGQTVAVRAASGVTWLSSDAQGTAQISIAATTQEVSIRRQTPFGAPRTGTGAWPSTMDKGFVGGTVDNTTLVHLGAREYDPGTGRFISRDPIVDTTQPQQMNGYSYANNSPVTLSDPTGKEPGSWCETSICEQHESDLRAGLAKPSGGTYLPKHRKPASAYKGPCDGSHSASNDCDGPQPSPWDIINIKHYPNGTTLYYYRNGAMRINGLFLPDGPVDADQLAERLDRFMADDKDANREHAEDTLRAIHVICQPGMCSFKFRTNVDLVYDRVHGGSATAQGLCVSGTTLVAFALVGGQACVFFSDHSTYVSVGRMSGFGNSLGVSVSDLAVRSDSIQQSICHSSYFASGSFSFVSGSAVLGPDDELRATELSLTGPPGLGSAAYGESYTDKIWQWGEGHHGDQIC